MPPAESSAGEEEAACCACFGPVEPTPKHRPTRTTVAPPTVNQSMKRSSVNSRRSSARFSSIYFEAQDGVIEEKSLEFFDALQDLEQTDHDDEDAYPIITRATAPQRSRRRLSLLEPESLLRSTDDDKEDEESSKDVPSFVRRASTAVAQDLRAPAVPVTERGFPGQLDARELAECQTFYREVTAREGILRDIVFCYKDIEEEPYTICRFLRPTKFSAADMLTRLENTKEAWEKAAKADFYRDLETSMGIPQTLLHKFYPFFYQGNAKNGCPVNYFKAGKIHVEGLLSMVTLEQLQYNAWHTCKHVFPRMVAKAQERNPNFVRCESINVLDLEGMTSSQAGGEAMEIIKQASKVGDFFPETMHAMLILNAPAWFSVSWRIIRSFIDPRTARKIEVYSNTSRGHFRLQQLVHATEIPLDFGGMGPPTDQSKSTNRESVQLIHVSKRERQTQEVPCLAEVAKNEKITALRIYSRSSTGLLVDFAKDGMPFKSNYKVEPPTMPAAGTSLSPYVYNVIQEPIQGPCKISMTARADPDEKKPPSKSSFGYFVAVAFISQA